MRALASLVCADRLVLFSHARTPCPRRAHAEALIDRKIVPQKWVEQQKSIRDAIAVLYADVPLTSDKVVKFRKKKSSHEDLHYFDCRYIFECLKQTDDGAAKNFFGQVRSSVCTYVSCAAH